MKKASLLSFALFALPLMASAAAKIQDYIIVIAKFLNSYVIPLLMAIALLFFMWGIVKYFIISGASSEGREQGKSLLLWGILAFVFMVSIWGIVRVVSSAMGTNNNLVCPDYYPNCNGGNGGGYGYF